MIKQIKTFLDTLVNTFRLNALTRKVAAAEAALPAAERTAVVFNASTRLGNLSLNAAYSLLTAWGLRQSGWRVIHFVCQSGMSRCLLGSSEQDPHQSPPCQSCVATSRSMFAGAETAPIKFQQDETLAAAVTGLSTAELAAFSYDGLPLGELVLPSIRWRMRRHHLEENYTTLFLFREFILSAYQVAKDFRALVDREKPEVTLVFNGQMFPEAVVAHIARQNGIFTITHETGYQPYTVFMTTGDATARKVHLSPEERTLTPEQNAVLDQYLEERFQGQFSMGGIQFWQEIQEMPAELQLKLDEYNQIVPVFTNVIFDTSQAHANHIFEHMFAWLDAALEIIRAHPETLFVLRAHPDELRPNSHKKSNETVQDWLEQVGAQALPNLVFINPLQYVSSYDLVQRSKFVLAYNSSIALEAALMGRLSVCAGWAWYADYPTVILPDSQEEYRRQVDELLSADQVILPEEFHQMARSLVYYQNFKASIPFGRYLEPHNIRGYVRLRSFDIEKLTPQDDLAIKSIIAAIQHRHSVVKQ